MCSSHASHSSAELQLCFCVAWWSKFRAQHCLVAGDMDLTLNKTEVQLRKSVYDTLKDHAQGATIVSASDFQQTLKQHGLTFGSDVVDRIMLSCKINQQGQVRISTKGSSGHSVILVGVVQVDFSHFEEDVQLRQASAESGIGSSSARAPATPTASGRGAAFQAALSNVTGHSPGNSMPAEIMALPQEEKVKRLARDIHSLFQRFDAGALSVDHFREQLHALGVEETEESRRLLRQTPLNFSDFFRALTHTDPVTQHAAGRVSNPAAASTPSRAPLGLHAAGSGAPLSGRRLGPRVHEQQGDIVTWRGGTQEGGAGIGNTRGKYDNRHITETGAGAIIFNKEETADTPIKDVADWHSFDRTKGKESKLPAESGVGKSLWGPAKGVGYAGEQDLPDTRFESVTQANARAGLGGAYASARPKTSAGYSTADHGLLREQVYGIIRQLDQGTLTTKGFASQLNRLGVGVPPAVAVLLQKYDSNGSATFKQFVSAFQDYFAERAAAEPVFAPPPAPEGGRPDTAPEANRSGRGMGVYYSRDGLNRTSALHAGHGDILTWQGGGEGDP